MIFSPKIPYDLVAERSEANQRNLTFPYWCSILKIVRTHFAACGGEEIPPPAWPKPLRRGEGPRKFGKAAEPHR
ncbi:MAG: hypothetical protein COZ49_00525 [Candidatus Yonathbacteria bacterium CG_4_10_14_3_um_filter_47_65]|uniref:Uncharacterized protein n=1 Tax=Candidatus Yonathbacteria bacterium CG_4_9_14_0_8_um_filter_46_47 TaxID=1975106 RepID=A0A2M8D9B6_9BACT|nr:MAG: hypothetical protein COZ49_00525 [Candidatus Yonathbacteria bacterium CG_4_10_14_3_um_filter_47_65]PJB83749.1 MAG: hypothetical protein CO088_00930 [Candidatus Yonathbacteria bacterium CG_4_9_14_0_8_um_filter_46_47]PJC21193.1 MAG: hypothetical protein CO061_00135 [Candidatus Yonathbacteria bacterium CG_4_9_14_0_2_um_filter_47_74]PJC66824.1 MAG: hypothetical protein CO016_04475 [Candidatus Yonathbacteria bacterium CG_4_8_14_3_um_filter_46_25]